MAPKPKKMITLIMTCTSCGASEEKAKAVTDKSEKDIKRIVKTYEKLGVIWLCGYCGHMSKPTSAWDDVEKTVVEL